MKQDAVLNANQTTQSLDGQLMVINTRPAPMGLELQAQLADASISSLYQPALENRITPNALATLDIIALSQAILIFISRAAVDAFYQQAKLQPALITAIKNHQRIFAVGSSTAVQLREQLHLSEDQVQFPEQSDSEGLLSLAQFNPVTSAANNRDKNGGTSIDAGSNSVFIFKGKGGRDLLKTELTDRGFEVSEWSLYERLSILYQDPFPVWSRAQWMLVTSKDVAKSVVESVKTSTLADLNHWRWLVFSARIKTELITLGIENSRIHICEQMDNSSIIKHIKRLAK